MNRLKFYKKTIVDNVPELDYLYNNVNKFRMEYPASYYVIKEDDLLRPDLISYRIYGTVKYWWLIMVNNGIEDIFNDLKVGLTLQIPNVLDIFSFYKKYVIRT